MSPSVDKRLLFAFTSTHVRLHDLAIELDEQASIKNFAFAIRSASHRLPHNIEWIARNSGVCEIVRHEASFDATQEFECGLLVVGQLVIYRRCAGKLFLNVHHLPD